MFDSRDAVNHSLYFVWVVVYHTFPNPTLSINFGMGCLNGLVFSAGDHINTRRHTFAVLQPEREKRKKQQTKTINMLSKSLEIFYLYIFLRFKLILCLYLRLICLGYIVVCHTNTHDQKIKINQLTRCKKKQANVDCLVCHSIYRIRYESKRRNG